jgi:hypothetical protein
MIRSSEFPYRGQEKNEKLISMCKFMGSDTYLSGSGGKAYVDEKAFKAANIKLSWHRYNHPRYIQSIGGDFEPNMSVIDLLFNTGPKAKEIIMQGGVIAENPTSLNVETELKVIPLEQAEKTLPLATE